MTRSHLIILVYCILVAAAVLIVPWTYTRGEVRYEREFAFLFADMGRKSIDYGMVALELVALSGLAGAVYLLQDQIGRLALILEARSREYWASFKTYPCFSISWWKRLGLWILSLTFIGVSVAILTDASKYAGYRPEIKISEALGASLIFALVSVLWLGKRKQRGLVILSYSLMLLAWTTYQSMSLWEEGKTARNARQALTSMVQQYYLSDEVQRRTFDEPTYGEFGPALTLLNDIWNECKIEDNQLAKVLEVAIGADSLRIEILKDKKRIEQVQGNLKQAMTTLGRYENNFVSLMEQAEIRLSQLKMSERNKTSLLEGFNHIKESRQKQAAEMVRLLRAIVASVDSFLEFMKGLDGKYSVTENRIVFSAQSDKTAYEKSLAEIDSRSREYSVFEQSMKGQVARLQKPQVEVGR